MTRARILLVDDHRLVREALKALVNAERDLDVVGEAGNGEEAVRLATMLEPHVVMMDVSMPDVNGLEATLRIRECCPATKVLVLTRHADVGFVRHLLAAGAAGYVLKQSAPSDLLHAVRTVARGEAYVDPAALAAVVDRFGDSDITSTQLTGREAEVLRLAARGHSNADIAGQLGVSVKTVETHKANGMTKLGMRGRMDLVRYGVLQGWLDSF